MTKTIKRWYVLTDGTEVYDFRQMDNIDALKANNIMIESTDGVRYWKRVPESTINQLIDNSR